MSALVLATQWLFTFFHSLLFDWGLSVIAIGIFVRLLTVPLQIMAFRQQRLLKLLKPQLDQIVLQYKSDPTAIFQKQRQLQKTNGVRLWTLPTVAVIQILIFTSIYRVVKGSGELMSASFLWLGSLGRPDAFYILPIVAAILVYLQMRLQMKNQPSLEPSSSKVTASTTAMKLMPAVNFLFMLSLPSGLVLFYAVSNAVLLLTEIGTQKFS